MASLIAVLRHRARLRALLGMLPLPQLQRARDNLAAICQERAAALAEAEAEADAAARAALAVRPAPTPVTRPLHVRQTDVTYRYIEAGVECTWSGQGRPPRSLAAQLGHPLAEWGR